MYETLRKDLEQIQKNPGSGKAGQQQHISVTAILANITADLVEEVIKLRKTTVDLDSQNDRLTKITTVLSIVGVTLALIQVLPIVTALVK